MSNIPRNLRYSKSHEWVSLGDDGVATIGITDYAQASLGDITYVQLPKLGTALPAGANFGVVESVKAASDVYAPLAGTVVAANLALDKTPELINQDPFAGGWIMKLKVDDPGSVSRLLDADGYAALIG